MPADQSRLLLLFNKNVNDMEKTVPESVKEIKALSQKQFEAIYKLSSLLNSLQYTEALIEEALDLIIGIIDAERGLFVKYEEDDEIFTIIAARNFQRQSIKNLSEFSSGVLNEVIKEKRPLLYYDTQSDPALSQYESIQIHSITSIIGVPVYSEGRVWGVIIADSRKRRKEFTNQNLFILDFFSNLISLSLDRILRMERLQDENRELKNRLQAEGNVPDMIGGSKKMREFANLLNRVAANNATVLITGESGTGKDLAARAIHKLSDRKDKKFLAQFCGAIPDTLLESELFGYKKGAFTGATSDKKGLLEIAEGGTFFLDEIGDISVALQAKLLRVIENREIIRLGDTAVKKIDVRIVAATNKNLQELVKEGKFREDLYYRLNVIKIHLPPLRERKDDIPLLADHFIKKFGGNDFTLHPAAIQKLQQYSFPGNVRQLMNILQRAIIYASDKMVKTEHIVFEEEEAEELSLEGTLQDVILKVVKARLSQFDGNRTATANSLGVSRRWIYHKLDDIEKAKQDE